MPLVVCDTKQPMTLDAAQHRSGKGAGDENFPVASWLVAPPYRRPIMAFYEFVRIADDIADHPTLSETDKLGHLDRLEASLLGRNVKLCKSDDMPKTLRMIVGDNAEIRIP